MTGAQPRFSSLLVGLVGVLLSALCADAQTPTAPDKAEALSAAARSGDAAAVAKLLDEGVDVNTKFRYDATALSYASDRGHLEVVKVLLASKADVNIKDTFYGTTALSWASSPAQKRKPEHAQIVGLLLKAGATGKENALAAAIGAGDLPMVLAVLEVGGLAPAALSDALEGATRAKRAEIVAALETAGAKPHPVVQLTETQLARYAGTYRSPTGSEVVLTVISGRLVLNASGAGGPANLPLVARSETAFASPDMANVRPVFSLEGDKVTGVTVAGTLFSRTGGL